MLADTSNSNLSYIPNGSTDDVVYRPEPTWPLLKQPAFMVAILSTAYFLVLVMGVINNSLVVAVIYRNPQLRTVTNYFLANLAIADILVSVLVLPITLLSNLFNEWWYGPIMCKAAPYLQGVAVSASVNTLAAVAVQGQKYVACTTFWQNAETERAYMMGVFLTCYLIPLLFIATFYLLIGIRVWKRKVRGMRGTRAQRNIHKSKIRIVRMLVVVFVIFALFWLPLYSINLRIEFGSTISKPEKRLLMRYLMPFAQWLGAANSCVNPFVYCYYSNSFRRSIMNLLRARTCCGKSTA
ncbi:hypothetical protein CAPTEDRAFT_130761 [Capitella teleta]|uniref:G-protein coupled receptors family 1 profile domain-containing protein n=1 Tax=Capitella teleta TaxID=283909 RepID=R7TIG4_CAPTE|nr:hypothetical protein CAPTEDRAFT_130761 [Capitella teleta]|eukprot:ELT93272.1 hypothetical protein CAPTEDRAFT_130761 [Capitella teleta]